MNSPISFKLKNLIDKHSLADQVWYHDGLTYAEVIMRLYEKYGIWIESLASKHRNGFKFRIVNVGINGKIMGHWREYPTFEKIANVNLFSSPTEAYEAAIEFIIGNILVK